MLVGTGVQRVSRRHVDAAASTATQPAFTQDRDEPLAPGATVSVPVQVLPMAHVFRAGSKIRVTVAGVNGDRERWAFGSIDPADRSTTDSVHLGGVKPSSISFTIAPLGKAPAGLLPCPAAGKPSAEYVAPLALAAGAAATSREGTSPPPARPTDPSPGGMSAEGAARR